jgi:ABC-type multidrug transport system ATPase subunit
MKQRLAIGLALLSDPALLILDEPTNGLDPEGIADIRQLIRQLSRDEHRTIIFSSHILSEVEQVCTHIGILRKTQN